MANRFSGPAPTQNNNNHILERSSTRLNKPPGGGSTIGSLIFGGDAGNDVPSYMDDRKARRFPRQDAPEQNPVADKSSYYGNPTAVQRERDNITLPPGAVSRDSYGQQQQQHQYGGNQSIQIVRRSGSQQQSSAATGDYFAGDMGNQDGGDGRRTKRMYGPPGGASSFKLG